MRQLFLLILLLTTLHLSAQSPKKGTDYAFLFYVSTFEDKGWQSLPETRQEVLKLEKELLTNYGFTVEVIPNATKEQILTKIETINKIRYKADDQVFFFFSTHGYYDKATDRGYLIPADGKANDPYGRSWISYDDLGTYITVNSSEHILLALDACHSGAFGDRFKTKPDGPIYEKYSDCKDQIKNALAYNSRLYFTSGSKEQKTPAKSLFASRWLTALRKGSETGIVRANDLRYHLGTIPYPQPENGSFSGKHQEGGDFVFVHKNACADDNTDADLLHWESVGDPPDLSLVKEHLELFPGCTHYDQALQIAFAAPENSTADKAVPDPMVFIKGGTFQMGSADGGSDEKPVHQVTLSDYYIGKYEVTVREFSQFVEASNYKTDAEKGSGSYIWDDSDWQQKAGVNWRHDTAGKLRPASEYNHPVIHVSWNDAIAYCNWLSESQRLSPVYTIKGDQVTANWQANGYRLPTEAEWEYAARSRGGTNKWAGTSKEDQLHEFANYRGEANGFAQTGPVGSLKANGVGLFDMSGNVYEWCWDLYANYDSSAQSNPTGATSGSYRVIRGGSWLNSPALLRCANRRDVSPGYRSYGIGFRLSRAVP